MTQSGVLLNDGISKKFSFLDINSAYDHILTFGCISFEISFTFATIWSYIIYNIWSYIWNQLYICHQGLITVCGFNSETYSLVFLLSCSHLSESFFNALKRSWSHCQNHFVCLICTQMVLLSNRQIFFCTVSKYICNSV